MPKDFWLTWGCRRSKELSEKGFEFFCFISMSGWGGEGCGLTDNRRVAAFSNSQTVKHRPTNLGKIRDFPKPGQTPLGGSPIDFFDWKLLGCRCFDVWTVFGWFHLDFDTPPPAWTIRPAG